MKFFYPYRYKDKPGVHKFLFVLLLFISHALASKAAVHTDSKSMDSKNESHLLASYTESKNKSFSNAHPKSLVKEVRGIVRDSLGVLPGVAVSVKGNPNIGTITDPNGKYQLDVPNDNAVLVYRMVGYLTQEISIAGKDVIDVNLTTDSKGLEEVVVVAFGTQKKTEVVGAVTSINPAELKVPSSNLTTALAGRVAGMISYQRSGEPGADNANFFIRGVTTFGYKKDPLILIDNVEVSTTDLARLQVDDIAGFTIMKDATATSLYGARGANGVILITTKEGKEGQVVISARVENSISASTKNVELADPITYMRLANEAVLTRDPLGEVFYPYAKIDNTVKNVNPYAFPVTDWQKMLLKKYAMNQRANLSVSGGGKVARYFISGAVNLDNGILNVDKRSNFNSNANLKTYSLRSNININLTKTTEVIARLSGSFDDYTGPIDGGTAVYNQIMQSNPVLFPAYYPADDDHQFVNHILFGNAESGQYINPYANLQRGYKDYSRSTMYAQFEIKQNLSVITDGLSIRAMMNTNRYSYFDVNRAYNPFYYSAGRYDRQSGTYALNAINEDIGTEYLGYSEGIKEVSSAVYLEGAVNYSQVFKEKHSVSGMLVGIMRNNLVGNAGSLQNSLPFRNLGVSGRATYTFDNKYSAEFNFGYNGSERFDESHRFGFFPSAGVAYTVSNEAFWEPLQNTISMLKLRATYGLVGNDAIGSPADRFFYLSNVEMNSSAYGAVFGTNNGYSKSGILVSRYSNRDISWEKSKKMNLGFQASLFKKIEIEADYFTEERSNILMNRASIPTTMGLTAPIRANVGKASAKGIDGSVVYNQFFKKDLWLQSRVNFTYAKSKFTQYEEPDYDEKYKLHTGYSLSQQWGYIAERLFVDDYEADNSPKQNFGVYGGGDIKYKDVNEDGQITTLDQVPIGFPTDPQIIYGVGLSAGFKRFDISFFFQGSAQSSFWLQPTSTLNTSPFINNQTQLLKAYADDHWSEDNQNIYALWPRLSSTLNANNTQRSTWFMRNGSFLRLKQVEIAYTLPESFMKAVSLKTARFYVNGSNLLSMSGFKLWDVEMGGNGLGYPVQMVFNAGLQISL
ncbi:MAG: SusC/RagA family TonB-linked outer membrane protein [Sphingobacteriaceae bacterium]